MVFLRDFFTIIKKKKKKLATSRPMHFLGPTCTNTFIKML
jgi:hypothetical protein